MEIVQHLRLAWQNDSFYMQITSKRAADIFESGVAGYMAGRITGVISPRDGAIYSIAGTVSDIFVEFIENRFIKEPLMTDEDLEKDLRWLVKIILSSCLTTSICSLTRVRDLGIGFNRAKMKFVCVAVALRVVIQMTFVACFPSKPEEAS